MDKSAIDAWSIKGDVFGEWNNIQKICRLNKKSYKILLTKMSIRAIMYTYLQRYMLNVHRFCVMMFACDVRFQRGIAG